jgi:hypothetical protein
MSERKTAKIITRVTQADRDWLEREAERVGLDPSAFIRMTLRRERNEREASRQQQLAVA